MKLFRKKFPKTEIIINKKTRTEPETDIDDEETVAAITAAIACMLGTGNFIVRNIKRMPEVDSLWSTTGRINLMR